METSYDRTPRWALPAAAAVAVVAVVVAMLFAFGPFGDPAKDSESAIPRKSTAPDADDRTGHPNNDGGNDDNHHSYHGHHDIDVGSGLVHNNDGGLEPVTRTPRPERPVPG